MSASALVCLAPGSEETEAVTTIDLLVRGGIKVTTASVASDGNLAITCSRGVKLLADAPLVEVADGEYDVLIVLPATARIKGARVFSAIVPCWLKPFPALNSSIKRVVWDPGESLSGSGRLFAAGGAPGRHRGWCRTIFFPIAGNMTPGIAACPERPILAIL